MICTQPDEVGHFLHFLFKPRIHTLLREFCPSVTFSRARNSPTSSLQDCLAKQCSLKCADMYEKEKQRVKRNQSPQKKRLKVLRLGSMNSRPGFIAISPLTRLSAAAKSSCIPIFGTWALILVKLSITLVPTYEMQSEERYQFPSDFGVNRSAI